MVFNINYNNENSFTVEFKSLRACISDFKKVLTENRMNGQFYKIYDETGKCLSLIARVKNIYSNRWYNAVVNY